ncbi:hypothetical protein D9M71_460070 [compost metagenome]
MTPVADQVGLDVVVAHADLGGLVALADHMEPPVAGGIAAKIAHRRLPVVAPDQVGDPQVHGEQCGQDEQGAFVQFGLFVGHLLGGLDHVTPLQLGERAAGDVQGVALLVDRLLFDCPKRIDLGEAFIGGVLEEAATHGEHLSHRSLGHLVGALTDLLRGRISQRPVAFGHGHAERTPGLVHHIAVGLEFLAATDPHKARFDHRADPVLRRPQTELHEGFGIAAAQLEQRLAGDQQGPQQQTLDMGAVGIEGGLVAGVGLQKPADRHVALDGLEFCRETGEVVAYGRQFFAELQEVQPQEATVGLEQRKRGCRHAELSDVECTKRERQCSVMAVLPGGRMQYMQYPGLAVIGYCVDVLA